MFDVYISITALAFTVGAVLYAIGRWVGSINSKLADIQDNIKLVNIGLNNHITKSERELTDIQIDINMIKNKLRLK
ncbi:MAG: hypothetical protein ACP5MB_06365 [bacterium]